MKFLLVMIGGGTGATLRYGITLAFPPPTDFPDATLITNVSGSLIAGVLVGCFADSLFNHDVWGELWRLFLLVGVLGGLTTFPLFHWKRCIIY